MRRAYFMRDPRSKTDETKSTGRTIAIGDIHGCSTALHALLAEIHPEPKDTIVTIGDYIDRGPDSRGVIETLLELRKQCCLVPLLGNHEEMLFSARSSHDMLDRWLKYGGATTLASYDADDLHAIPSEHDWFLDSCRLYYETNTHFFIHANYDQNLPLRTTDRGHGLEPVLIRTCAGSASFRQDGDRRPHGSTRRRNPRLGLPEVHRHELLWRRVPDGPGCRLRPTLAGTGARWTKFLRSTP